MAQLRTPSSTTASLPFFFRFPRRFASAWPTGLPALACVVLAATAAQADTLRGRVVDPDGRAVPGAHVSMSGGHGGADCRGDRRGGAFVGR